MGLAGLPAEGGKPPTRTGDACACAAPAEGADSQTVDPRVAAVLPAQLLQSGEIIVLLLKPSPWYILLESLSFLTGLGILLLLALALSHLGWLHSGRRDLVLAILALAGLKLFWQFLEWLSRFYVLTDRRIVTVRGVLRVQVFECSLKKIQHTTTTFSIRERFFGLGSINFFTAGTATVEATWRMIAKPLDIHRIVVQTLNRYR